MESGEVMDAHPNPVVAAESTVHVLHVDDEPGRLRLTKRRLEQSAEGVEIVTASDPRDALGHVGDVDCVVSDYEMGPMNGLEFLEEVRRRRPNVPFILFTGAGSESVASEAISAGVTDYVVKDEPQEYTVLAKRIANAVRRTRAENRMQEGFRAIERASEGIALLDANTEFTYVNPAFADIYRYDREAFVGEHWRNLYPDDEADHLAETVLPLLDVQDSWSGEVTGERRDGSTFIAHTSLGRMDDGGLLCLVRDVTEHLERERRLAESRARYRTFTKDVLDSMDVGVFVLNPEFEVAWVNAAMTDYLGIERAELIGRSRENLVEVLKPRFERPERVQNELRTAYEDNTEVVEFECHVVPGENREERWLQHWSRPIESGLFEGGRIEHYTDVTERKHRREKLERQNERLEKFASVVSHDLKNPLGVAKGFVEVFEESGDQEAVAEIDRSLDRMEALIEDVLTLAREGETVEDPDPIELQTVVDRAWRYVDTADATRTVASNPTIVADAGRLQEVLENLVQNAVTHVGPSAEIRIGETTDGFFVADDGPGIPVSDRNAVFEPGYSTDETGTGFGLNIVREIATAHGWTVSVTDSWADGARFEFTGVEKHD